MNALSHASTLPARHRSHVCGHPSLSAGGLALALLLIPTVSEAHEAWRLDGGLIFDRFAQQVKHEIGGAGGERLVEHTALGVGVIGTYRSWGPFSAGLFTRLDIRMSRPRAMQGSGIIEPNFGCGQSMAACRDAERPEPLGRVHWTPTMPVQGLRVVSWTSSSHRYRSPQEVPTAASCATPRSNRSTSL